MYARVIARVFPLRRNEERSASSVWKNLHQVGVEGEHPTFLTYSGLTANGARTQRRASKSLYRVLGSRFHVWHRNLFGHTGRYQDFRRSRMWDWIADACRVVNYALNRDKQAKFFLIGESTGALVVTVLAYLYQIMKRVNGSRTAKFLCESRMFEKWFPRLHRVAMLSQKATNENEIRGLIVVVPAFRLCSRRDEFLLLSCLVMYYLLIPIGLAVGVWVEPRAFVAAVISLLLVRSVFPRIWVPTGDAMAENMLSAVQLYSLVGVCFYIGMYPLLTVIVWLTIPRSSVEGLYYLYALSLLPHCAYAVWSEKMSRQSRSPMAPIGGYFWLPVVTTATMILLQWIGRFCMSRLECPVLFVYGGKDAVVCNVSGKRCFDRCPSQDKAQLTLESHPHSAWTQGEQDEWVTRLTAWVRDRLPPQAAVVGGQDAA